MWILTHFPVVLTFCILNLHNGKSENLKINILYNEAMFDNIGDKQTLLLKTKENGKPISISCFSNNDTNSTVKWKYYGLMKSKIKYKIDENNTFHSTFPVGFPVSKLECSLIANLTIKNETYIYTGNDTPPYLFNSGKSVKVIMDEYRVKLPCVLKYPLRGTSMNLRLYKEGMILSNPRYSPEDGFILYWNSTNWRDIIGNYDCAIENKLFANNTLETVSMSIVKGDFILLDYTNQNGDVFYAIETYRFTCKFPNEIFREKSEWYYHFRNGSDVPIVQFKEVIPKKSRQNGYYTQTIETSFHSTDTSAIVCAGTVNGSVERHNKSIPVNVKEYIKPEFINMKNVSEKKLVFTDGMNLTCTAIGTKVKWQWFLNDKELKLGDGNIEKNYQQTVVYPSTPPYPSPTKFTCKAYNLLSSINHTFVLHSPATINSFLVTRKDSKLLTLLIVIAIVAIFGTSLALVYIWFEKRNKANPYRRIKNIIQSRDFSISEKLLGEGAFGRVYLGQVKSCFSSVQVAIKKVKDDIPLEDRQKADEDLLNEISVIEILGKHPNIVGYHGTVLDKDNTYLVIEYTCGGDLKSYLQKNWESLYNDINLGHADRPVLKTSHLTKWAEHISLGLSHMASKNLIHMDLSAKNVLLAHQGINKNTKTGLNPDFLIAKISDFGLSKSGGKKGYYQVMIHPVKEKNPKRLWPVQWLAIETLEIFQCSTQSDIWSLAVTLWEMFTLARSSPYENQIENATNMNNLKEFLRQKKRLPKPEHAPTEIWNLMCKCWDSNSNKRPDLKTVTEQLHDFNNKFRSSSQLCTANPSENRELANPTGSRNMESDESRVVYKKIQAVSIQMDLVLTPADG